MLKRYGESRDESYNKNRLAHGDRIKGTTEKGPGKERWIIHTDKFRPIGPVRH
jgi:hypothetical protein